MPSPLEQPVTALPTVGPTVASRLHRLGLRTVRDMLYHFPLRYDDFRKQTLISSLKAGLPATVTGTLQLIKTRRSFRRRLTITEALLKDTTATVKIVWFNQGYLAETLKPGDQLTVSGVVKDDDYGLHFTSPSYEKRLGRQINAAGLIPVYPTTDHLTQRQLRFLVVESLKRLQAIDDPLPPTLRSTIGLMPLPEALRAIHFPKVDANLKAAKHRLAFDELFFIQLYSLEQKAIVRSVSAPVIPFNQPRVKAFVASLPFKLTNAQRKAAWEILKNMERGHPMNRLLEGDVGSGKTVVAAIAMVNADAAGFQSTLMAPTEILARQHAASLQRLLEPAKLGVALVTAGDRRLNGQPATKASLTKALASGQIDIAIGTHALLTPTVKFKNLGLAIVDEQHRFGVDHRKGLLAKMAVPGHLPHLLSMSATPIPRSLALTMYGDLDLSVIDEQPAGRLPIKTTIVSSSKRADVYAALREEVNAGRQAFVVVPLIERSEKIDVRSVAEEYKRLKTRIFPDLRLDFLHGQLASSSREKVMKKYLAGETDILVATSVVEVGIDVPNATVMLVENAERFGLAQLHQFRGRVGRGQYPSHCFLITESSGETTIKRLRALTTAGNGFELAEMDLEIRGSGELYGVRQSGFPDLKMAKLTDYPLIKQARDAATAVLAEVSWHTKYPSLLAGLQSFRESIHWE